MDVRHDGDMPFDPAWASICLAGLAACLAALAAFRSKVVADPVLHGAVDDLRGDLDALRAALAEELRRGREEAASGARHMRSEIRDSVGRLGQDLGASVGRIGTGQKEGADLVAGQVRGLGDAIRHALETGAAAQSERLDGAAAEIRRLVATNAEANEALRRTVEERLEALRAENAAKLDEMRRTVDEKLQGTLEARLGESFRAVSEHLERVHRSVGEMQALATGVGDLKRVLTNVKTRGTWAEVSLGTLLDGALAPDQYARNVETVPGTGERVEFAIRLPGPGGGDPVWLPIDAKFPVEDYERLMEASDRADPAGVEAALKGLDRRIRDEAAKIAAKYVAPPRTTDFGILYLPTEGLYAEVLRRPGLVDHLQGTCRIMVAGPTNLHAILTSLRMGFRTLAIEKRSSEVWQILGAVKTEFGRYGDVLDAVKKKLAEASTQIDKVSVRSRAIDRRLREVETLPEGEAGDRLALDAPVPDALSDAA